MTAIRAPQCASDRPPERLVLWLASHELLPLAASTALVAAGLAVRVRAAHSTAFVFLMWNLALAWLPALLAPAIEMASRAHVARGLVIGLGLVWLALFPNAPYVVTDLIHLHRSPGIPIWFDATLLFVAGWTGLLLGFHSLEIMQRLMTRRTTRAVGVLFTLTGLGLAAVGVQLGRFERWNSWDLLSDPTAVVADLRRTAVDSGARHFELFFFALLVCGYWGWLAPRRRPA